MIKKNTFILKQYNADDQISILNIQNCNRVKQIMHLLNIDKTQAILFFKSLIIILTNDNLSLFELSAFKSKIKLYEWRRAPFLINYDKKK